MLQILNLTNVRESKENKNIVKVKKILVSQPKPASDKSPYFDIEQKYGVEVVFRPFIVTEEVSAKDFRAQKITHFGSKDPASGSGRTDGRRKAG